MQKHSEIKKTKTGSFHWNRTNRKDEQNLWAKSNKGSQGDKIRVPKRLFRTNEYGFSFFKKLNLKNEKIREW